MSKNEESSPNKRNELIKCAYELFVRKGLEQTSIRDIARIAGLNINSIYYYFRTKADIVISCVEYGLRRVIEKLFNRAEEADLASGDGIEVFFERALEVKDELCWCYQVVASPNYNWFVKNIVVQIRGLYKKHFERLCKKYMCDVTKLKSVFRIAILVVKDYIITEDKQCIQQLEMIVNTVLNTAHL